MSLVKNLAVLMAATPFLVGFAAAQSGENAGQPAVETVEPASETNAASQPAKQPAAANSAENQAAAEPPDAKENKRVCKHIKATGTRFGSRVCKSQKEWDQERRDSQDAANDIQRRNSH